MWIRKYWDFDLAFTAGAAFLFLIFVNIARLRPWIAPLHPTLVMGVAAVILLFFRALRGKECLSLGATGRCWIVLLLLAYLSTLQAPKGQVTAVAGASAILKYFVTYFITYNMITSVKTLKGVYFVFLMSLIAMLYFAFKVMIFTGGRLSLYVGPFYGINETAMGMSMFLPFCLVLGSLPREAFRWNRVFILSSVLCVLLIVRTFSRGGFVSLAAVLALWLVAEKRRRMAWAVVGGFLIMLAILSQTLFIRIGDETSGPTQSYLDRMKLIVKARNAAERDNSTQGRIDCAREAIRIWKMYPWFGVGPQCINEHWTWGAFVEYRQAGRPVNAAVHNSLLHVLMEQGLFGFLAYLALLFLTRRDMSYVRKWKDPDPFLPAMFTATYIGFIAWFVGGLFLSEQFNWCFVIFTGMAAGARRVVSALEREESAKARSNIRIAASIPAAATAQAS